MWHHCNADSLKTLKANYMLIRLLCVYRMIKYVRKILIWNLKRLLRKLQKNLFCRTLYMYYVTLYPVYIVLSTFYGNVTKLILLLWDMW